MELFLFCTIARVLPTAAFLDLSFLTIFVGVIVYSDKCTGWIQYDLLD